MSLPKYKSTHPLVVSNASQVLITLVYVNTLNVVNASVHMYYCDKMVTEGDFGLTLKRNSDLTETLAHVLLAINVLAHLFLLMYAVNDTPAYLLYYILSLLVVLTVRVGMMPCFWFKFNVPNMIGLLVSLLHIDSKFNEPYQGLVSIETNAVQDNASKIDANLMEVLMKSSEPTTNE